ncbi:multicopper oxidase family protein [Promicromonospora sp. NPDC060204]|uniref:multicopper oxidase family protein n=1 Tax=Promicromonospora sp. NPDC060204 TaxID=3347071 RepID=UPI00366023BE
MRKIRRREFLGLAAVGAASLVLTSCASGGTATDPDRPWQPLGPLRIPDELRADGGVFRLTVQQGTSEILPGTRTPTWGVNGPFLGPTLRMRTGDAVRMAVTNDLPEVTTMHWHGMHLLAKMDGGPHQPIEPGTTWEPSWTVRNTAATLWYHPHTHGATAQQVFKGVAGMIIVDDDAADAVGLPHEYGVDDIPCILQDRTVEDDGEMPFDTEPNFGQMGTEILVNGTMGAYLEVARTTVRFRFLNGSNARVYHLGFADDRELTLVATDQGLVPEPVRLTRFALGPGERAEVVAELEPGERVRLTTTAGEGRVDQGTFPVLELRVADDAARGAAVPAELPGAAPLDAPADATVRTFKLQGHDEINGRGADITRVDEVVPAGAREVWEVTNTVYAHNFHVHGCAFTLLDRNGAPGEAWETGQKDTVHLPEKSTVRLAVQFGPGTDPTSPYMYHCHILRHEDDGMMGQFVVVEPGTEDSTPRVLEAMGHMSH